MVFGSKNGSEGFTLMSRQVVAKYPMRKAPRLVAVLEYPHSKNAQVLFRVAGFKTHRFTQQKTSPNGVCCGEVEPQAEQGRGTPQGGVGKFPCVPVKNEPFQGQKGHQNP